MSNPFDEFDESNPFDEFDKPEKAPSAVAPPKPSLGMATRGGERGKYRTPSRQMAADAKSGRGLRPVRGGRTMASEGPSMAVGPNEYAIPSGPNFLTSVLATLGNGAIPAEYRRDINFGVNRALNILPERVANIDNSAIAQVAGSDNPAVRAYAPILDAYSQVARQALTGDPIDLTLDPQEAGRKALVQNFESAQRVANENKAFPTNPRFAALMEQNKDSLAGSLGAIVQNPGLTAANMVDSTIMFSPAVLAAVASRGRTVPSMLASGVNSFALEQDVGQYFAQKGIDITTPEGEQAALAEINGDRSGLDRYLDSRMIVTAGDTLSAGMIPAPGVGQAFNRSIVGTAGRVGAGVLGDAVTGGGTEYAAMAYNDPNNINMADVALEAVGAPMSPLAIGTAVNAVQDYRASGNPSNFDSDTLRRAINDPATSNENRLAASLELMNRGETLAPAPLGRAESADVVAMMGRDPVQTAQLLGQQVEQEARQEAATPKLDEVITSALGAAVSPPVQSEAAQAPRSAATSAAPEEQGLGDIVGVPADDQWDILRQFFETPETGRQAGPEADLSPAAATPPVGQTNERRQDPMRRKAINEMTPDELRAELMTSPVTGGRNRRAYQDAPKKPVQVALDADNLKWVNDNMGHQNGDSMIAAIHEALAAETDEAYHISGDEFVVQADSQDQADAIMARVQDRLARATITATLPDGRVLTKTGIGVSYGSGQNLEAAESALGSSKAQRASEGRRFNREVGGTPEGVAFAPAEGNQTQGDAAPAVNPARANIGIYGTGIDRGEQAEETNASRVLETALQRWAGIRADAGNPERDSRGNAIRVSDIRIREVPRRALYQPLDSAVELAERILTGPGRRIAVISDEQSAQPLWFSGAYLNNTLYVNATAKEPLVTIVSHEFVHGLKESDPDLYQRLADYVAQYGDEQGHSKRFGYINEPTYSRDKGVEELTANLTAEAMTDPNFLRKLAAREPSLFRDLAEAFIEYLDGIMAVFGRNRAPNISQHIKDVEAFRDLLADILVEKAQRNDRKADVLALADEIGWAQEGGQLIARNGMDAGVNGEGGGLQVTGRTSWVPKPIAGGNGLSNFWQMRPGDNPGEGAKISERAARVALRKYANGEKMTAQERRFIAYAEKTAEQYRAEREGGELTFSRQEPLIPEATPREQVQAAAKEKDASRNSGSTDMMAGEGELFAGERPAQEPLFSRRQKVADGDYRDFESFKRWSNNAPMITSEMAKTYQFKTGEKVVVEAFHGAKRPDRIGYTFLKKRATSGPMAYHTSSPELASNYATGKQDTSLSYEDNNYENWFKVKFKGERSFRTIDRAWYGLSPEQKDKIAALAPRVTQGEEQYDEDGKWLETPIILADEGHNSGLGGYDWQISQTRTSWDRRGNPLKALVEEWLNSGSLFNQEERFMDVLRLAGFPMETVTYDSPTSEYPFVFKNFIAMRNPLVTNDIPQSVTDALRDAARRDRSRPKVSRGADMWDKNTRTLKEWVDGYFEEGNNAYIWTSIPDKVTDLFRGLGYDGIIDWSGKSGAGEIAPVYIPFEETQVKSAVGNNGNFSEDSNKIHFSRREQTPGFVNDKWVESATGRTVLRDGRLLTLLDAAKKADIDMTALRQAYAERDFDAAADAIDAILAQMRPEPMRSTGLKNAVTDAERAAANKDPILREAVKGNEATLYEAMRTMKGDPLAGPEAISRLNRAGAEGISLADEAVLLVYKTELMNKRDAAAKKLADPESSEDAKNAARQVWEETEAGITAIDLASVNAGREWGRFGQFRQRMLKADFTLEAMERKERARLERPLNAEESARIKAMADKIAELQAKVEILQRRKKNASSEGAYEALERALRRPKKERKSLEYLKKAANDARARIAAVESVPSRRGQSGAVLSPAILKDFAIVGAYHIANGAAEFADWVSAMSAELGEKFDRLRDKHRDIFGDAKRLSEMTVKTDATVDEVMAEIDMANIKPKDVRKLIEALIGEGLRGEPAVIGAAAEKLELSEDDVRALFIQTEPRGPQTLTEAQEELRDLKKIVRLEAEIDRLEAGKPKPPRGEPAVDSPEVAAKKQELAELRKRLRPVRDPEERYQELRGKQIEKRIADLQERIARGDFAKHPRIPRALNEANQRALFELDKAKEDFLRYQYLEQLKARSNWGKALGFTANAFNLSRAMMTSLDLSGLLRQGGFITFGRPKMAVRDFVKTLPALFTEEAKYRVMNDIKSRPNAPLYLKYKLALTEIGAGPLTRVEEAFASAWIEKLERVKGQPIRNAARTAANIVLAPVRGSGRVYTAFLNLLRADAFDALAATMTKTGLPTEAEAKWIVDFVNTATGRAKIWGRSDNPGEIINALAFAPRLVVSRMSLATMTPIWTAPSGRAKKLAAMEYARFLTGVAVASSLLAYGLGDDDDDQEYADHFTFDPRSSDFMKLRFGNTRLDPFTGISQVTTMMTRLLTGETVNAKGEVKPIRPKWTLTDLRRLLGEDIPAHEGINDEGKLVFGERTSMDVIASFLRSKLAPIPGAAVNIIAGSDFKGDPITMAEQAKSLLLPMSFGDIADAMEENGIPRGTAMSMLALLGMSMQVQTPSNRQQFAQFTDEVDAVKADVKERLTQMPIEEWPAAMKAMKNEYGHILEGVELDYYKQDGKYGFAGEPKRDRDGNPVLKSNRLSDREKYDDGLPGTQVHHIIPDNLVRRHPLMAAARKAGYDLDNPSNLISMPNKAKEGEVAHTTDHPDYDAEVYGALQEATKRLRKEHGSLEDAPPDALLEEVRKVEEAMRERLMKKDVPTKDGRLARVGGASQMGA